MGHDLTTDHQEFEAVTEAARWLATTRRDQIVRPIVPTLRQRFGLSAKEACEAIGLAARLHVEGGANDA